MFDVHMHSRVFFDGRDTGRNMARAAAATGLKETCFTDHMAHDPLDPAHKLHFDLPCNHSKKTGKIVKIVFDKFYKTLYNI